MKFFLVSQEFVVVGRLIKLLLNLVLDFLCVSVGPPLSYLLEMGLNLSITDLAEALMSVELDGKLVRLLVGVGVIHHRLRHHRPLEL